MKGRRLVKRTSVPLRWDQVPHAEIRWKAQTAMSLGSPSRAAEDSLRSILKRRLPLKDPADHQAVHRA
jgi:hypothetical protein